MSGSERELESTIASRPQGEHNENSLYWSSLRERSLEPGGFGDERAWIWPKILHVPTQEVNPEYSGDAHSQHPDERQIRLDTDRSFVLYPEEDAIDGRAKLQEELYKLIVEVFRRHPGLSYFQGYHDIVTVLFLTLPQEVQLVALEKMSLHRLRDAMGKTLEPIMGLLRVLQRLLQIADPEYAAVLEEQAPLPFAALSHLLTLFAHDVPTLPLAQHFFDYLLARPPIAIVYLAAAIILAHRDEVLLLERDDEPGMIHSVLSSLPNLVDQLEVGSPLTEDVGQEDSTRHRSDLDSTSDPSLSGAHGSSVPVLTAESSTSLIPEPVPYPTPLFPSDGAESDESGLPKCADIVDGPSSPANIPLPPSPPPTPPPSLAAIRPQKSLPALLRQSDELMAAYPPSYEPLGFYSTFGSASAMRTWSEDSALLPPDAVAEQFVINAVDIILPEDPQIEPEDKNELHTEDELDEKGWFGIRRRRSGQTGGPSVGKDREKRKRRRLRKHNVHVFGGFVVERRTMLAGATLVLGVAMAVTLYTSRGSGPNSAASKAGLAGLAGMGKRLWTSVRFGL